MAASTEVAAPRVVADALSAVARELGVANPRFQIESGSNLGDGYLSAMYRTTIHKQDEADAAPEASVICKVSLAVMKTFMRYAFRGESAMYREVLPALAKMGVAEPLPWARCFRVVLDEPPPYCLVLEDLRHAGFVMAARGVALDRAHCLLVARRLARFHAAGMALRHLKPGVFKDLQESLGSPYDCPTIVDMFEPFLNALQKVPELVAEKFPEGSPVNTVLKKVYAKFKSDFKCILNWETQPIGFTFIHGDFHTNNILFKYEPGCVVDCRLIDFQFSHVNCPALDLATLLLSCTEKSMRDNHWDELLVSYYQELQATLLKAGCAEPASIYPWEVFKKQLQRAALYALCLAPVIINALNADDEAVQEMRDSMAVTEGSADTIQQQQDTKTEAQDAAIVIRPTARTKRLVAELVEDLINLGWLPSADEVDRL